MRKTETKHASLSSSALASEQDSLARALSQGLDTPVAALRATVESLEMEIQQQGSESLPPQRLDGVLREVNRLERNVRELCDYAGAPVPRPLACSLEEIVKSARAQIPAEQRRRVITARCEPEVSIQVDGPLLSRCLHRLLENALEATDELVLVVARLESGRATFSVIDDVPSALGPGWTPTPFQTTKPNHLGLGLALTQRDMALLHGRLEFLSTPGGETCVRLSIPTTEDAR